MNLKAENISMTYDDAGHLVRVFSNLNLEVKSGTSLAIVGNSGVGKTTLLNVLGGLEKPVNGTVRLGDADCSSGDENPEFRARNFGFVFQSHNLLADFTAKENVMLPLFILGESQAEASKKAEKLRSFRRFHKRRNHPARNMFPAPRSK